MQANLQNIVCSLFSQKRKAYLCVLFAFANMIRFYQLMLKMLSSSINLSGEDCSIPSYKGYWSVVKYENHVGEGVFGVASHSSVSYGNYLWITGGYNFQSTTSSLRMMRWPNWPNYKTLFLCLIYLTILWCLFVCFNAKDKLTLIIQNQPWGWDWSYREILKFEFFHNILK